VKTTLQVVTLGAANFKRGALVGGFEFIPELTPVNEHQVRRDREVAQFIAETMDKGPAPLHHFYVTEVTELRDGRPHSFFTISVHVETLAQAVELSLRFDDLTLYPLHYNAHEASND
jgi:hypothetical protein